MPETETPTPRARILLVDDVPANLVALETVLAPLGQELVRAGSGEEALRELLRRDFALIVMDVRMPGLDGLQTARLIRGRARTEHTPIIFVTAFDDASAEMTSAYATVGAADFVFKPIQPEILRAKAGVFVELYQKTEQIRRQSLRLRRLEEREHRRHLQEAELRQKQAEVRFAQVLEASSEAIVVVDAEDRVVLFNRGAERAFGWTAEEIRGRPVAELVVGGLDSLRDGTPHELVARRRDGRRFPAEASLSRLTAGEEGVPGAALILRDVTERRRTLAKIERLNADLAERLKAGIALVADVAASLDPVLVVDRMLARAVEAVAADSAILLRESHGHLTVAGARGAGRLRNGQEIASPEIERALTLEAPLLNGRLPGLAGANRTAVLPLLVRPEEKAALVLGRGADRPFEAGDLEMLSLISGVAAVSLRNAELYHGAEAASRSKSEFLNLAAHELRTPLSVVTGYLSMLADGTFGALPGEAERPLEILNSKASELNKLVDDLLLAARMEGGLVPRNLEEFDLRTAAEEAVRRAEGHALLLGGEIRCDLPDHPVTVTADRDHVARIVDNLVTNALHYTNAAPHVRLQVGAGGTLAVEDRGAGIPDDRHALVFERFWRGNDTQFIAVPGTGLGLFLSRELARSLGGDLVLEWSRPGEGSRFSLQLSPSEPGAPAQPVSLARAPEPADSLPESA